MIIKPIFESCWVHLSIILITLIISGYIYVARSLNYWKNKGIPYIKATFPFGSISKLILQRISLADLFLDLYKRYENEKYVGFHSFLQPQIIIRDLDIIKNVLVKDFNVFTDRGVYHDVENDPLSGHLFTITGAKWKNLRTKLSPTYTSGKMKMMYPTVKNCAIDLQTYLKHLQSINNNDVIDLKDATSRYGLNVISSTALGLEGNSFRDDNTDMRKMSNYFIAPSVVQMARLTLAMACKTIAKLIRVRFAPKVVEKYFIQVVKQNTEYRRSNNVKRNDFMQLLIDLRINGTVEQQTGGDKKCDDVNLTYEEMAAQSFVFIIAGLETTSATLSFCLYELALNPEIQDKLINEIDSAGPDLSYETLNNLQYLDMVVNETLRKYPPVAQLQRECSQDYPLPGGKVIEKGTLVIIPVIGLHRDPKLFPNPDQFNPERFSKDNIHKILPYSYLPFGEGPRICIGMRFGKVQVKLALVLLLSKFTAEKCEKTQIPLIAEKKTFIYNVQGGMWLRMRERK